MSVQIKSFSIVLQTQNPYLKEKLEQLLPEVVFLDDITPDQMILVDYSSQEADLPEEAVVLLITNNNFNSQAALVIQKPIKPSELRKKIIRFCRGRTECSVAGCLRLSHDLRRIVNMVTASDIDLTEKEYTLLKCLIEVYPGVCSKEELLEKVWGYNSGVETQTLETHIYRLRQKLKNISGDADLVESTAEGYVLKS